MEQKIKITGNIKKEFYDKLKYDKIQINWNKSPIEMSLFLSFLKVEVKRSSDHLGSSNGWTLLENNELKLKISGGIVNGTEFLDSLQFGIKLSNPYNNFINPFYLFEILTKEGRQFFIDYYKEYIEAIVANQKNHIEYLKASVVNSEQLLSDIEAEIAALNK